MSQSNPKADEILQKLEVECLSYGMTTDQFGRILSKIMKLLKSYGQDFHSEIIKWTVEDFLREQKELIEEQKNKTGVWE